MWPFTETEEDMLLDFLQKTGQVFSFSDMKEIFNTPVPLDGLFEEHQILLGIASSSFKAATADSIDFEGRRFVHMQSLISDSSQKDRLKRRLQCVPDHCRLTQYCAIHCKSCYFVEHNAAFCVYLYITGYLGVFDHDVQPKPLLLMSSAALDVDESISVLDPVEEKAEAAKINDVSALRAQAPPKFKDSPKEESVYLPIMPTLRIGNKDYLFLYDIVKIFDYREDFALHLMSQMAKHFEDFVELETPKPSAEGFSQLALEYDEITNAKCLALAFDELENQAAVLPTEEEFVNIQKQLNIKDMGKTSEEVLLSNPEDAPLDTSSVDIWQEKTVHLDEEVKAQNFVDPDDFVRRNARKRKGGIQGPDSSLAEYIPSLRASHVLVYHSKLSKEGDFSVMCLKALSANLGGWAIPQNFQKVILVERMFALSTFGYAPGLPACRASYALLYAMYAQMTDITDTSLLEPLGRTRYLRLQRCLVNPHVKEEEE